jgi:hypothetical protein
VAIACKRTANRHLALQANRHLALQHESAGDTVIGVSFAETLAPLHYAKR